MMMAVGQLLMALRLTFELPTWAIQVGLILASWSVVGLLHSQLMLLRNKRLGAFRLRMLDAINVAGAIDLEAGRDWRWRYEAFNAVPYEKMLYRFWREFDDFYPDKRFLEP